MQEESVITIYLPHKHCADGVRCGSKQREKGESAFCRTASPFSLVETMSQMKYLEPPLPRILIWHDLG
eukprot:scaffold2139_cov79-Skeletonema_dohrnii-CCMP3373.AAC.7